LAAVDVSSVKGGGSPGIKTLVASDVVVVVEDGISVELVTSGRVVVVVLLVVAFTVVLVVDALVVVVDEGGAVAEVAAPSTTTTPAIPAPPGSP
jgi:hypothetical protein